MALVEGVKYGLSSSSQINSSGNNGVTSAQESKKSLIFVKLTDSALKAIEDFLRSHQKTGQQATLQFLGNEGRIQIPSLQTHNGNSFEFSLQSNADIEGPQGSFECIQQCTSSCLESLGTLPFKMRIHAKEDTYEATRQRINALEEERLHDCAKEIKQNGADIGRKVKKKTLGGSISAPLQKNRRESSPIFNNHTKSSLLNHTASNKKLNNGYYTNHNHTANFNNHNGGHPLNNNHLNPNNLKTNSSFSSVTKTNISTGGDISKRPLRDRLIHLLAVKPCKKPELLTRLARDGLRDKDKKLMMSILLQISSMKGNEYFLSRGLWNDVQEDWPFYTEQERQCMKRRKPQNLTPPGSDCSVGSGTSGSSLSPRSSTSGSGHSPPSYGSNGNYHSSNGNTGLNHYGSKLGTPNGTHQYDPVNGSVPSKRPGVVESPDNIPTKRPRISHFKRPNCLTSGAGTQAGLSPNQMKESLPNQGTSLTPPTRSGGSSNGFRLSPTSNSNGGVNGLSRKSPGSFETRNGTSCNGNNIPSLVSPPYGAPTPEEMGGIGNFDSCWSARGEFVSGNNGKLPDSDETDSVDSGNGSSSSSSSSGSAHSHHQSASVNGGSKVYSGVPPNGSILHNSSSPNGNSKPSTPNYSGSENTNGHSIPHTNGYGPCNRVSSTTNGTGVTPQCSPDSQEAFPQKYEKHHESDRESPDRSLFESRPVLNRDRERNRNRESLDRREKDSKKEKDRHTKATSERPSYITEYTKIRTVEERSRYKNDFNTEYGEYRNLHHVIDKVSKKFAHLEERLRQQEVGSPDYQAVKQEIVNEYYSNKKNRKYQEAKQQFTYLHDKLSHIKRLVSEYDSTHPNDQSDYGSREEDYNDF